MDRLASRPPAGGLWHEPPPRRRDPRRLEEGQPLRLEQGGPASPAPEGDHCPDPGDVRGSVRPGNHGVHRGHHRPNGGASPSPGAGPKGGSLWSGRQARCPTPLGRASHVPVVIRYRVRVTDVSQDVIDPTPDEDRLALERALAGRGEHELFPCDPALADTAAFCAAYGFAPEDAANTIIVIGKSDPPRFAACVVLATRRLDVNRTVRDRLGTRRASFASPDDTRSLTGHEIGGVTVFGLPDGLPVWVDAAVMTRERIVLGGGSRRWKVIAAPSILLSLPGVEVVEGLANPVQPRELAPEA